MKKQPFYLTFHKLTHWEYWPFQVIYVPIYLLWIYYSIKARSLFFFNAVNPSIKNGGFVMESKKKVYDLIPQRYYPKTSLITKNRKTSTLENHIATAGFCYPLIAKPDVGLRGAAVQKIHSFKALQSYHQKADFDYLIQDFIPYSNEIGVFYVRYPNQQKGKITGMVSKEPLCVVGDGILTIADLIKKTPRFHIQLPKLEQEYKEALKRVLPKGEKLNLMPYGSHSRGAKFIDSSHLITEKLTSQIDTICQQIDGFYYGRLDIMYRSIEELEAGENFMIVELNGAKSEPVHIYDPNHSLFFAWRELARHITYLYQISRINHRQKKASYLNYEDGIKQLQEHFIQNRKILKF
ncbi:D-alanine--D-alanine ligase [Maribacter litoralis]|uniref:D-alanine--D-alanine ligase n=1 Tax=Maribacter litoralis TaxID=2059726 RepID=UPI003F5CF2EE